MTRYEFFEAWMTPEEWREWKRSFVIKVREDQGLSKASAIILRERFLEEQVFFNGGVKMLRDWRDVVDARIIWSRTSQGHNHWQEVYHRMEPIRINRNESTGITNH